MTTANTVAAKLALLNSLRAVAGKAPLASWKNSLAELDQRILDMTPAQDLVHVPVSAPINPDLVAIVAASDVPVTHVPTGATSKKPTKDLDKKAARHAAKVSKAVDKAIGKVTRTSHKTAKGKKVTIERAASTPKSGNEFGAYLKAQGLDPKQARATLRRKGFSAPYALTTELKAALKADARKK